jgi:hypothetical protein
VLSSGGIVGYDLIAEVRPDSPAPATVAGSVVRWVDRLGLVLDRRYIYVVIAIDSLGRSSPPSERRVITFLPAPRPPGGLSAAPGDRQVTLTWQAPDELVDGSPATGEIRYIVLRGTGAEGALQPITGAPVAGTSYTDSGLENETEYRYAVRSVRADPRGTATGSPSATTAATPAITTAPPPPSGLVAIPAAGALRLSWRPSPGPSVALYAIFRAVGTGPLTRIATTPAASTTYIDRDVGPGVTYRYAVSAIDNARRPNESAPSEEVAVTIP